MPLSLPNLDDRDFAQLVFEAREYIQRARDENWDDLSPSDPGIVLIEVFAYLTDLMLYRLNRLPEKAYIAFLRMLGVTLIPPAAARVVLTFSRAHSSRKRIEIKKGTRVTVSTTGGSSEPPIFITARQAFIEPGQDSVDVYAYHCEPVDAEKCDRDNVRNTRLRESANFVTVQRPPIIAPTPDGLELVVGVETSAADISDDRRRREYGRKTYRIWREVQNFSNIDPADPFVYVADRITGTLIFAPKARLLDTAGRLGESRALAEIPPPGQEIRVWYWRGGGDSGNLAAGQLTVLKDPIPGVSVTNAQAATGGSGAETLENALVRGPQQIHSLDRVVTARDFERAALDNSRAIVRALALTARKIWAHSEPGQVELLVVPDVALEPDMPVSIDALHSQETDDALRSIQELLEDRLPMGTSVEVRWAAYKQVHIEATIIVNPGEDTDRIHETIVKQLYRTINPLAPRETLDLAPWEWETIERTRLASDPQDLSDRHSVSTGWPFGQPLYASDVHKIIFREGGVNRVDDLRLVVDTAPDAGVTALAADAFQTDTWFASGLGNRLFRSFDNGTGWEQMAFVPHSDQEQITRVRTAPHTAGLVAVITSLNEGRQSRLYVSRDCGESWSTRFWHFDFEIEDLAWIVRGQEARLLLATDRGLYDLGLDQSAPVQILVDRSDPDLGFYAIVAFGGGRGVALAAQGLRGIYLSSNGGASGSFRSIGLQQYDVRVLAVQHSGVRAWLWAGTATPGGDTPGTGCMRWELRDAEDSPEGWVFLQTGWTGGSCLALDFNGDEALAATYSAGVLRLNVTDAEPRWQRPHVNCGLPLGTTTPFARINSIVTGADGQASILAGGPQGVYVSTDGGETYTLSSRRVFTDKVTLPSTWIFVSGQHNILVKEP